MWDSPAIPMGSMLENPLPWYRIGFHFRLSHQSGLLSGVQSTATGCFMMCLGNFHHFSCATYLSPHVTTCYHCILCRSCQFRHVSTSHSSAHWELLPAALPTVLLWRRGAWQEIHTVTPWCLLLKAKPSKKTDPNPAFVHSILILNTSEYTKCNFGNFASCTWLCRAAVSLLWVISSPQITESFTIWLINPHKIK